MLTKKAARWADDDELETSPQLKRARSVADIRLASAPIDALTFGSALRSRTP